jgi:hypothetical protein
MWCPYPGNGPAPARPLGGRAWGHAGSHPGPPGARYGLPICVRPVVMDPVVV